MEPMKHVDAKGPSGGTPLGCAAITGHKAVVELLIANKADVNVRANAGVMVLHAARPRPTTGT